MRAHHHGALAWGRAAGQYRLQVAHRLACHGVFLPFNRIAHQSQLLFQISGRGLQRCGVAQVVLLLGDGGDMGAQAAGQRRFLRRQGGQCAPVGVQWHGGHHQHPARHHGQNAHQCGRNAQHTLQETDHERVNSHGKSEVL